MSWALREQRGLLEFRGSGGNESDDPPENEATQKGRAGAPQFACGSLSNRGFRCQPEEEDRSAEPQAQRRAGAADGDLPRAEPGVGAAGDDLPRAERSVGAAGGDLGSAAYH